MQALAILEVMWDWRGRTTRAGYRATAPIYYKINPQNHSGKRLYWLLGIDPLKPAIQLNHLLVTNACPNLVSSPKERGTPDTEWLRQNIVTIEHELAGEDKQLDLILVCGKVAQKTFADIVPKFNIFEWCKEKRTRLVFMPHPAARCWNKKALERTRKIINESSHDALISVNSEGKASFTVMESNHV